MHDYEQDPQGVIAIIGLGCRFPKAADPKAFWTGLEKGESFITYFEDKDLSHLPEKVLQDPNHVKAQGIMADRDKFDAPFFGLTPREAEIMDPQQRFFLEVAWEALEDAGYNPETHGQSIGVFAGTDSNGYWDALKHNPQVARTMGGMQLSIGNEKDYIAPRVSYLFNLGGPSVPVQTACSTSLVAVHMACQSLISGECDMALAGGVSIPALHETGYLYQENGILSPDGRCRTFDAQAKGTVPGSGVGVVLLKRLEDAMQDWDQIHAVILGSAINNDGSAKVGFTAPSVDGQSRVIREAMSVAGVEPQEISYVEAHGTATTLGDPIEVEALNQAFGDAETPYAALGSVKTNLGHCNAAAGIAGLLKTVLCLKHKTLVPSLHFEEANPAINFEFSPFYVNTKRQAWNRDKRIAGVSSFGIGGTNAHAILAEAPPAPTSGRVDGCQLFTLSANTESALASKREALIRYLASRPETEPADRWFADTAYTLNVGRKTMKHRQSFVAGHKAELVAELSAPKRPPNQPGGDHAGKVVFMFPGQGTFYKDFGVDLYRHEPVFRACVDQCCTYLNKQLGLNLADLMFAEDGDRARLEQADCWQPAIFVSEYALAKLYMSWGVQPTVMIGHSIGEYTAAVIAGILRLEDVLRLVALRGRLTLTMEPGAMIAVSANAAGLEPFLYPPLSLAAVNGPNLHVLSGPVAAIDAVSERMKAAGLNVIRLDAHYAFHSAAIEPIMDEIAGLTRQFKITPPDMPYISNLTGAWITGHDLGKPDYWAKHMHRPVLFHQGLNGLSHLEGAAFLEVGPGHVLTRLAQRHPAVNGTVVAGMGNAAGKTREGAFEALGILWAAGVKVDWQGFYAVESRRRLPLPTYPFERQSYWLAETPAQSAQVALQTRRDYTEWFYRLDWEPKPLLDDRPLARLLQPDTVWLVLSDGAGEPLAAALSDLAQTVVRVKPGQQFAVDSNGDFTIDSGRPGDYERLFSQLAESARLPAYILHTWRLGDDPSGDPATMLQNGFDSLIHMVQACAAELDQQAVKLGVVLNGTGRLGGSQNGGDKAALIGAQWVIPKEYGSITCLTVDLDGPLIGGPNLKETTDGLLREFLQERPEPLVHFGGRTRYVPVYRSFQPPALGTERGVSPAYRKDGVYLVTNGLQEIGFSLAERLTHDLHATVVLVDRQFFPKPEEWADWLADQGPEDAISLKIERLKRIGGAVHVYSVPLNKADAVTGLKETIQKAHGLIDGVFHLDRPGKTGLIQGKTKPSVILRDRMDEAVNVGETFLDSRFIVYFSENPAETGALGQVEQVAVYGFLDHHAHTLHARGPARVTAISWGTRSWGHDQEDDTALADQVREKRARFGMKQGECLDALAHVIAFGLPHVIVSTRDYQAVLEQQNQFTKAYFQAQLKAETKLRSPHARPGLSSSFVPPRNEIESGIAEMWTAFFGIDKIGIHDNFFELGGHSLLALQLLDQLKTTYSLKLDLPTFFESPTIADVAGLIIEHEPEDADEMAQLLAEIEGLSDEEIEARIAAASNPNDTEA